MKRGIAAAVIVLLGGAWYMALPSRTQSLPALPEGITPPIRGAIHVHSRQSDGTGTVDEIAAAAARVGLNFVILTDHGDATREPDAPRYRSGVLCIDAVEISTDSGHLVALGLPAAPYPLGGEARDVIDDIARLGGFAVAAHPGSPKPELQWRDWNVPLGGLEWLNSDSEWRDESKWVLTRALFTYPFRPTETLAGLLDRPDAVLQRWDALTRQGRVIAIAGSDAHGRVSLRNLGEPYDNSASLPLPSYERVLGAFSNALPGITLTGEAEADARTVLAAIRSGHLYSAIDGAGRPAVLSFTATAGTARAGPGDVLPATEQVTLQVDVRAPADARIDLYKDGSVLASQAGGMLERSVQGPAVYRVEVALPQAPGRPPVPWILSNPIYVGRDPGKETPAEDARRPPSAYANQYANGAAPNWTVEHSPESLGAFDVVPVVGGGTELALRYALGGAASASPFVALAAPAGPKVSEYDRLTFMARADRPMRLSVQLRQPSGEVGERWHRSVFLDTMPREITVFFDDLAPRGATSRPRPTLADVGSILFVIDTVNTPLGGNGRVWIDEVKYAK